MPPLNLPPASLSIQEEKGQLVVFDILRRRRVALTPEEWVRQHFVHFLINEKHYPVSLLANEVSVSLNGMTRRCDSVLYDLQACPRMIIEYKAPSVPINQRVFNQISRYNIVMHVDYLMVSNGLTHYCCRMDYAKNTCVFLREVPEYGLL